MTVNPISIVRCHRMGNKDNNGIYHRPMIVRFLDYNNRKLVWAKRMSLADTAISISENDANGIEQRRKLLYPIMKKSKKSPTFQQGHLKGDKLVLHNDEFSVNDGNLSDVPSCRISTQTVQL